MAEALMKMQEVCDLCQVTRFTVRRWYRAGLLPAPIRMNRTLRWRRDQVEAALRPGAEKPAKAEA